VPFYRERSSARTTLGSLLVVLLLRWAAALPCLGLSAWLGLPDRLPACLPALACLPA
jgi:hypothetical protein